MTRGDRRMKKKKVANSRRRLMTTIEIFCLPPRRHFSCSNKRIAMLDALFRFSSATHHTPPLRSFTPPCPRRPPPYFRSREPEILHCATSPSMAEKNVLHLRAVAYVIRLHAPYPPAPPAVRPQDAAARVVASAVFVHARYTPRNNAISAEDAPRRICSAAEFTLALRRHADDGPLFGARLMRADIEPMCRKRRAFLSRRQSCPAPEYRCLIRHFSLPHRP